jgi:hypothetical protein
VAEAMREVALSSVAGMSWERVAELTVDAYRRHLLEVPAGPRGDESVNLEASSVVPARHAGGA